MTACPAHAADRRPAEARCHASRRGRLVLATTAAFSALLIQSGLAGATTAVSSNWSGYAVTGATFTSVSGTWVQPAASCAGTSTTTASAFWVGLGGDSADSTALEQTGTEADCLANGSVRYTAWYELVPAASVRVDLAVSAGDRIAGSVRVSADTVSLELRNLTTGKTFRRSLRVAAPDTTSAEWIAEAPSTTDPGGRTAILPLTDFGTVRFLRSSATTSSGRTGTPADPDWTAARIVLRSGGPGRGPAPFGPFAADVESLTQATPSTLGNDGAFSVTWRRLSGATAAIVA